MALPDFVTHYARAEPFRSLTQLPPDECARIAAALSPREAWGLDRFLDPDYLPRRAVVERRLREAFVAKGGRPALAQPIYFFLGRHAGFEAHPANRAYTRALAELPPDAISFTYGDSLLAWDPSYRAQAGPAYESSLCGELFLASELASLARDPRLPREGALAIEAQVWVRMV